MDLAVSYHNCGRPYGSVKATSGYPILGAKSDIDDIANAILKIRENADELT